MELSFSKNCQPLGPKKAINCQPLRSKIQLNANEADIFVNSRKPKKENISFGTKLKKLFKLN